MIRIVLYLLSAAFAAAATADVAQTVRTIGEKHRSAGAYAFEGEIEIAGRQGAGGARILSRAKVKLASAPEGKSYLRLEPVDKDAYVLVSNGQKNWAWVPKLKQYTEEEGAFVDSSDADEGSSDDERDLAEILARMVMPALARLHENVEAADFDTVEEVRYEKKKQKFPVLRVLSRPAEDGSKTFTQLAVHPETQAIARMVYSNAMGRGDKRTVIQMTLDFTSFEIGPPPDDTFTFEPPKGVKLVDIIPIPGQSGSFLLNRTAPDFELKTLDGEKVSLSDLRGHPVLLAFWATWCGPCRRELPRLSELYDEYKSKGLVVLGVNNEGKATARKFAGELALSFRTLDDWGSKRAYRLYRVYALPAVFLIDKDGKVVRFFRGAKETAVIRAALAGVGL